MAGLAKMVSYPGSCPTSPHCTCDHMLPRFDSLRGSRGFVWPLEGAELRSLHAPYKNTINICEAPQETRSPTLATMTDSTLVSPPDSTPISPVSRTAAFPPTTSSAVANHAPFINTSVPAINAQPVELDGIPTSPQAQETKRREMSGSKVHSSAENGDIDAEFLSEGGKGAGQLGREVRCFLPRV
jgi:hypothetical protein